MPKAPVINRFEITGEVAEADLGRIMVQLDRIEGLTITGAKLITEIAAFRSNNRSAHETTAAEFITAWIQDHPTFHRKELLQAFRADGRKPGSFSYGLTVATDKGLIKRLDEAGNFSRADVHHIAPPKKAKAKPTRDAFDVDHREFILRYARMRHGKFSSAQVREHFERNGRKAASVGGALFMLVQRKQLKLLGEGQYELTAKAKPKPKPESNGNGAHVATPKEETVNG